MRDRKSYLFSRSMLGHIMGKKKKYQRSDLSGLVSLSCLRIDPNGGRWSGFSLQQAFSSELMFSSHSCSDSTGRRSSPWKGVRNCIIISGENIQQEAGVAVLEFWFNSHRLVR